MGAVQNHVERHHQRTVDDPARGVHRAQHNVHDDEVQIGGQAAAQRRLEKLAATDVPRGVRREGAGEAEPSGEGLPETITPKCAWPQKESTEPGSDEW